MKVLVTGANGQLGHDVVELLKSSQIECKGVDLADFDLTVADAVDWYITDYRPTVVVHCAAFTAVDRAEEERETCFRVNVTGTENIAKACRAVGASMMYISTDYVFSGEGDIPFEVNSIKKPSGYYGMTKSMGEDKVQEIMDQYYVVRTAWVFGVHGNNFVRTMLRLGKEKPEIQVVNDQFGSPTYTCDLALMILDIIKTTKYGVYHVTNEGFCSWYDFACAIMQESGLPAKIIPISSEQYSTKAIRPKNSRLSKASLDIAGFARLPNWKNALRRYLIELRG